MFTQALSTKSLGRVYRQVSNATEPQTMASSPDQRAGHMLGACNAIGEIAAATAPELRRSLRSAIDGCDTILVLIDFSSVTFVDSAAYHALVDATTYAVEHHHVLALRNVQPFHAEVLRFCDWANQLNLDAESALISTVAQLEFWRRDGLAVAPTLTHRHDAMAMRYPLVDGSEAMANPHSTQALCAPRLTGHPWRSPEEADLQPPAPKARWKRSRQEFAKEEERAR
jgi:anti-anti-sigma factor